MLWYLLDRTRTGFGLASVVSIGGTGCLLWVRPDIVPLPVDEVPAATTAGAGTTIPALPFMTYEQLGMCTWIASVLFCSSLCFGNAGRWLAKRNSMRQ